LADAAVEDITT